MLVDACNPMVRPLQAAPRTVALEMMVDFARIMGAFP